MRLTIILMAAIHASHIYAKCGTEIVFTGATPCTFCPAPTCTNIEVYTLSCSCQGVVLPTITEAAPGCQSYGPCDTLSCATEIATWTVPCPTTYVSTESIKKGGCATIWSTVTGTTSCAPPAGTPCTTPYCVEQVDFTVDCDCTDVVSTTTVGCPTTCDIPCPTTSYSYSYTDCTTATTTGIVDRWAG